MKVELNPDDLLAAELAVMEIVVNRQPNLPRYVKGENCDICGRGVPKWEFVALTRRGDLCAGCVNHDDYDDCQVGRSHGGDIICSVCGTQVWAPTPQLRHCPNCYPSIWEAIDDNTLTVMQLIARLDAVDAQREFWNDKRVGE